MYNIPKEIINFLNLLFQLLTTFFFYFIFSRFVPPQTSSGNRFLAQQNSPVPSPYAPQSPAGYLPYSHPPSYTPHPQMQQGKSVMFVLFSCLMSALPSCACFTAF